MTDVYMVQRGLSKRLPYNTIAIAISSHTNIKISKMQTSVLLSGLQTLHGPHLGPGFEHLLNLFQAEPCDSSSQK